MIRRGARLGPGASSVTQSVKKFASSKSEKMADKIKAQAAKEQRQRKMQIEYDTWHSKADCTGIVPKKGEVAKAGPVAAPSEADKEQDDGDSAKRYKQLETGVMRLLVVSFHRNVCTKA
jgi:hypothetical protein